MVVVMLNFLIAIVSQAYENVISRVTQTWYAEKVELNTRIKELEARLAVAKAEL